MKTLKNNKGFTLIELIVVIAILGVLALILVPQFMGYVDDADIQTQRSNVKSIHSAAEASLAKLKTLAKPTERTKANFKKYIEDSLGDSFGDLDAADGYKVTLSSTADPIPSGTTVEKIEYNGCIYTVATNEYTGSCKATS